MMGIANNIFRILSSVKATAIAGIFLAFTIPSFFGVYEELSVLAWVTIAICGYPLVYLAITRIIFEHKISSALLISIAMFASVYIGEPFAAGEVAFIMAIGAVLEEKTVERAERGIKTLSDLMPSVGRLVEENGNTRMVPIDEVAVGDVLRVVPGESVPADGEVVSGSTSIDQSIITGESIPIDCSIGDSVFCGTVNLFGSVDVKVSKRSEDSSLKSLINMVKEAENDKSPVQRITDRWAVWLVPIALLIALAAGLLTGDVTRAVTVLVVFCPCALALAAPTTIVAAVGQAAKHGIIIKSGRALEAMGKTDRVVFDKTGTLTLGTMSVSDIVVFDKDFTDGDVLFLAASVESRSEHPLAKAIVAFAASQGILVQDTAEFSAVSGRGAEAWVGGTHVLCGNETYLEENKCGPAPAGTLERFREQGKVVVLVASEGKSIGCMALSDIPRPYARDTVSVLEGMGVKTSMLTGDHRTSAKYVAEHAGISDVHSEMSPLQKMEFVKDLQTSGEVVCMIGDGINDAPVMKSADVGIVMGGIGSDITIGAADVVLIGDDLSKVPYLRRLSGSAVRTIMFNIAVSMCINFVAVALSVAGYLDPITGALVHNAGSVLVVTNAALFYDRNFMKKTSDQAIRKPLTA
ncbi:MAG: cation-translocating P-type ATPase [Candidatus Methanoplasma sp.]|jgi:heavy metal translocating P-type ATPase|nr:cation-translocating P-type ATPase [Candidatus Methanoplasma sp.]